MYLLDIPTLASVLPQNAGCEHTDTTVELDGEGAECVHVPAAGFGCLCRLAPALLSRLGNAVVALHSEALRVCQTPQIHKVQTPFPIVPYSNNVAAFLFPFPACETAQTNLFSPSGGTHTLLSTAASTSTDRKMRQDQTCLEVQVEPLPHTVAD